MPCDNINPLFYFKKPATSRAFLKLGVQNQSARLGFFTHIMRMIYCVISTYTHMNQDAQTISWKAPTHEHAHKDSDWFWGIGVAATAIAIISILGNNPLFALLIVLGTITLFMHAIKSPHIITISVDSEKIMVEDTAFLYEELDSFLIARDEEKPLLILKTKRILNPRVIVPLDVEKSERARECLLEYLPEKKLSVPLSHQVLEFLGL
mgnify:CR=1 FL=1